VSRQISIENGSKITLEQHCRKGLPQHYKSIDHQTIERNQAKLQQATRIGVKNLIVNADDLGWTEGVNRGIAVAHRSGIVTSASLLANGAAFASGVELARSTPVLGVGVHLNLSDGAPIAEPELVPSLVNDAGQFEGGPEALLLRIAKRGVILREVEQEWEAQIEKVKAAGIQPTHLDGHKHVHMLPGLFEIALRLAKRYGIGAIRVAHEASSLRAALSTGGEANTGVVLKQGVQARGLKLLARDAREQAERANISTADYFCGIAQTGEMTKEGLARLLRNLPDGTTELMSHPGYVDEALQNSPTRLQASRQTELEILTDCEIRNIVASHGIRLIDYGFVASEI
jgi:chitin disaccharide deacetylase